MIPTILKHAKNIFVDGALVKYAKAKAVYSQERDYVLCDITFTVNICTCFYRLFLETETAVKKPSQSGKILKDTIHQTMSDENH